LFSDANTKLTLSYDNSPIEGAFVSKVTRVNIINVFGANVKHLFRTKFLMILIGVAFGKNVPKYGAWHKSSSLNTHQNLSKNVGDTEQHLLRHLLCASAFVHYANCLVMLTPRLLFQFTLFTPFVCSGQLITFLPLFGMVFSFFKIT
jgi:hypothetical protein